MPLQSLLEKMWLDYCQMNRAAHRVYELFLARGETVLNDHIALRTLNHPRLGIKSLARVFEKSGYVMSSQDYTFTEKKLYARHFEHPDTSMPKIFISELQLEKVSHFVREEMTKLAELVSDSVLHDETFPMSGRPWPMSHVLFQKLAAESEYASWFAAHGFRPNHFTVNVNALKTFKSLSDLNSFVEANGFTLNKSGGIIKGTPAEYLEQSSTMASEIPVTFSDGTFPIPGCYYEFAKRYAMPNGKLYQGFVAASADKIFESTNRQ